MKPSEHDLRAPVAAIEGYTRMILGSLRDEKTAWRLEGILASCRTLEHLIENIRLAKALEEDRLALTDSGGDLDAVLKRVADGLARAFESKRAALRLVPINLHLARGAELIERIAAALLLAALHTSEEGAEVGLGAIKDGRNIQIFVVGEGVAGPGPGACVDLVAEAACRFGGEAMCTAGRLAVSIPEQTVV